MNIVRISAGLGNQMFQYAFYKALKENASETKMDISEFQYRKHHNGYELEKIFYIETNYATKKECNALADLSKDFFSGLRRNIFNIKRKTSGNFIDEGEVGCYFHPELLTAQNSYFQGFWQTEKYFSSIKDKILSDFSFKIELDNLNRQLADEISSCNSVSIHIRRGDYVKKRRLETVGSVCSIAYYQKAIEYLQKQSENLSFYIFSDDIIWTKENLQLSDAHYIDNNHGDNSYKDMQLMSLCQHNIIANSSFSWWGAWLNRNPQKTVIAPGIWFRDAEMPDIVPVDWIRIDV